MKKNRIIIISAIIGAAIILLIGAIYFITTFVFGFEEKHSITDISKYEGREKTVELAGSDLNSLLMIFPELEYDSIDVEEFLYEECTGLFGSTYEIVISYKLDEMEFEKEVARIAKLRLEEDGTEQKIVCASEGFNYPAYVTIFQENQVYEYALIDEENHRIICVCNQFTSEKTKEMNSKYLPASFEASDMLYDRKNIYYFKVDSVMGADAYKMYGE